MGQAYLLAPNSRGHLPERHRRGAAHRRRHARHDFNGTGELAYSYNLGGSSKDTADAVTLEGTQIAIAGTSTQVFADRRHVESPRAQQPHGDPAEPNGPSTPRSTAPASSMLSLNQAGNAFGTYGYLMPSRPWPTVPCWSAATPAQFNYQQRTPAGLLCTADLHRRPRHHLRHQRRGAAAGRATTPRHRVFVQSDGKVVFLSGNQVVRTTAPAPAVTTTTIITTGTGKKAKATGVTITFNTGVNPTLATNVKAYMVRPMKGKKVIKLKKKSGISYNAATRTLTFNFAAKTAVGKGFRVIIAPGGIVGADGQVLNNLDHPDHPATRKPAGFDSPASHAGRRDIPPKSHGGAARPSEPRSSDAEAALRRGPRRPLTVRRFPRRRTAEIALRVSIRQCRNRRTRDQPTRDDASRRISWRSPTTAHGGYPIPLIPLIRVHFSGFIPKSDPSTPPICQNLQNGQTRSLTSGATTPTLRTIYPSCPGDRSRRIRRDVPWAGRRNPGAIPLYPTTGSGDSGPSDSDSAVMTAAK